MRFMFLLASRTLVPDLSVPWYILKKYKCIITIEEAFVNKGGLDCLVSSLLRRRNVDIKLKSLGFEDKYIFKSGSRDFLHELSHFGEEDISRVINYAFQDNDS